MARIEIEDSAVLTTISHIDIGEGGGIEIVNFEIPTTSQ